MKFSEMPYKRPDTEALKQQWTALTQRLEHAATYEEARAAFLEQQALSRSAETQKKAPVCRFLILQPDF